MPNSTPSGARSATPARSSSVSASSASERVIIAYRGPSKRKGFAQIPNVVLLDRSLSHAAKVLYGVMVGYAMQHEAFETDQAAIAGDLGYSDRSVRSWMKELLDAGLLTIQRRGLNQPNVYLIEDAYALYDQTKPQPKNPTNPRWDRKNLSGPARQNSSGPGRKEVSGQDRKDSSGPYLKGKNLKKEGQTEDKKESLLPAASPGECQDKSGQDKASQNNSRDKDDAQRLVYQQGAAGIKVALHNAARNSKRRTEGAE